MNKRCFVLDETDIVEAIKDYVRNKAGGLSENDEIWNISFICDNQMVRVEHISKDSLGE